MASNMKEHVRELAEPIARQMGLYLVDVENARMGKSRLLRIYVDCDGGIDIDKCEAFHRAVVDPLEEIDYDYLEVYSPGDRPLKSDADFLRMKGREVEVRLYAAREGKKVFEGVLDGRENGKIRILCGEQGKEDQPMELEERDVSAVKPLFRLDF